jgi:hypothetical protein
VWYNEQRMAYVSISRSAKSLLPNESSVGLRVTSLKWTGPDPEGSEALPTVPSQLEYKDEVPRTEDIGFIDEPSNLHCLETGNGIGPGDHLALDQPSAGHGVSGFREATQDIAERQKLQNMMPVSAPQVVKWEAARNTITDRSRPREHLTPIVISFQHSQLYLVLQSPMITVTLHHQLQSGPCLQGELQESGNTCVCKR